MALFNFGKKKKEKEYTCACNVPVKEIQEESCCCCGGENNQVKEGGCECVDIYNGIQSIKVLGAGCKSCREQYENVKEAVENLELSVEVEYITDIEKVMAYGVMSMPAIVVNEKVVSMGKVLKKTDVEKLIYNLGF